MELRRTATKLVLVLCTFVLSDPLTLRTAVLVFWILPVSPALMARRQLKTMWFSTEGNP
jgi:hypothetical protein